MPAEVLVIHSYAIHTFTATTDRRGHSETVITHPGWLAFTCWSLVAACVGLYLLGHMRSLSDFDLMDLLRLALPAVAFVGWTMVEKPPTAFDAACLMTPFSLCVAHMRLRSCSVLG